MKLISVDGVTYSVHDVRGMRDRLKSADLEIPALRETTEWHHNAHARAVNDRDNALRRLAKLEEALREVLRRHDGTHAEDCPAYGADDVDVVDEPGADPHCVCGATQARNEARTALNEREDEP